MYDSNNIDIYARVKPPLIICMIVNFLISGDLLENFCMNDDWANAARWIFTITIMLTYPIECFVTREVFLCFILKDLINIYTFTVYEMNCLSINLIWEYFFLV